MTEKRRQLPVWQESILLVITAMVMAVIVKTFFLQAFYIPSESMEPTMLVDDKLLVQKVSYWAGEPKRGDIVVFDDPGGWLGEEESRHASNPLQRALETVGLFPTGGHLIKRVIGVGGDEVVCCTEAGKLTVNGTDARRAVPSRSDRTRERPSGSTSRFPTNHLWVMGDNRGNSADSRSHLGDPGGGFIAEKAVVGKAWLRVWPWNRAGIIHKPSSFEAVNDK